MVVGTALRENRPVLLIGRGERRHSFIAAPDVAAFGTAAAENEKAKNRSVSLGGPAAASWRDVIGLVESHVGQTIPVHSVPPGQPLPQLPDLIAGLLTAMEMADVEIPCAKRRRPLGLNSPVSNNSSTAPFQRQGSPPNNFYVGRIKPRNLLAISPLRSRQSLQLERY